MEINNLGKNMKLKCENPKECVFYIKKVEAAEEEIKKLKNENKVLAASRRYYMKGGI